MRVLRQWLLGVQGFDGLHSKEDTTLLEDSCPSLLFSGFYSLAIADWLRFSELFRPQMLKYLEVKWTLRKILFLWKTKAKENIYLQLSFLPSLEGGAWFIISEVASDCIR